MEYGFLGQDKENQPDYLIAVICNKDDKRQSIIAFKIQDAINYLKTLKFKESTEKTAIYLGEDAFISIQRKGGDSEKISSNAVAIKLKLKPKNLSKFINKIPHSKYNFIDP